MPHREQQCEEWLQLRETDKAAWDALPPAARDYAQLYDDLKADAIKKGTWREERQQFGYGRSGDAA